MENKLQQLTDKLYNEGLQKGQKEAQEVLENARKQAERIIADAKAEATRIVEDATRAAAELKTNTHNEIRLAATQTMSSLRAQIEGMVVAEVVTPQVSAAWKDGEFVKSMILSAVGAFNPTVGEVKLVVPEAMVSEVKSAVAHKFASGVEVVTDARVKVPFRIAPADGSYYVSFTDVDFTNLIKAYIRPKVAELLFGAKDE